MGSRSVAYRVASKLLEPGEIQHLERVSEWLGRPAWNVIIDEIRRQFRKQSRVIGDRYRVNVTRSIDTLPPLAAEEAPTLDGMIRAERIQALRDAVDRLPSRQREVISLQLSGWSTKRIAYRMRCTVDNVDYHIRKAKRSLLLALSGNLR